MKKLGSFLLGFFIAVGSVALGQIQISSLPPATLPLSGSEKVLLSQTGPGCPVGGCSRQAPVNSFVTPITFPLTVAQGGTGDITLSGVLKGNGTSPVTSAAATDIISLWSGCSTLLFLRGDGTCQSVTTAPAGANTNVQYNNSGSFGGDTNFTYNNSTHNVTLAGTLISGGLAVTNSGSNPLSVTTSANGISGAIINGNSTTTSPQLMFQNQGTQDGAICISATSAQCETGAAAGDMSILVPGHALRFDTSAAANATAMQIGASNAGVIIGAPTGSFQGAGTLNMTGCFVNGVACATGSTSPGGATTNVQFNNAGAFGGNSGLVYNSTTTLGLGSTTAGILIANAPATVTSAGASMTVQGGPGGATSGTGGLSRLVGGTPTDGIGGAVSMTAANGATITSTARAGGVATVQSGNGTLAGAGGQLNLLSGNGGTTGAGGNISISAGNGGATSGNSGRIALQTQTTAGGGTPGSILLGVNGTSNNLTVDGATGDVSIAAPVSGPSLTVNGTTAVVAEQISSTGAASTLNIGWGVGLSVGQWNLYSQSTDAMTIGTAGNAGLALDTNSAQRITINGTGNVVVNAPSSLVALTVNGLTNNYSQVIQGSTTSAQSKGLLMLAGTTSADFAMVVQNATGTQNQFLIFGDGGINAGSPTGGDQGAGTINAQGLFINGVAVTTTGSYTATATGCTTSPTVTVNWTKTNNVVTLSGQQITCTSNAATFSLTGGSGGMLPTTTVWPATFTDVEDNTVTAKMAAIDITSAGTIEFSLWTGTQFVVNGWTSSGTKGVNVGAGALWTTTYRTQ